MRNLQKLLQTCVVVFALSAQSAFAAAFISAPVQTYDAESDSYYYPTTFDVAITSTGSFDDIVDGVGCDVPSHHYWSVMTSAGVSPSGFVPKTQKSGVFRFAYPEGTILGTSISVACSEFGDGNNGEGNSEVLRMSLNYPTTRNFITHFVKEGIIALGIALAGIFVFVIGLVVAIIVFRRGLFWLVVDISEVYIVHKANNRIRKFFE